MLPLVETYRGTRYWTALSIEMHGTENTASVAERHKKLYKFFRKKKTKHQKLSYSRATCVFYILSSNARNVNQGK